MFAQPDPILRDIPDHFETERLLIRVPRAGDGPVLLDAIQESIVELREWMDWARTSEWRKGYITEAVRGITGFAFEVLGAQRVEIRCDDHNTRSAAVAERAGFTLEGRLRAQALATSGGLRDTLIYALIRSEWQGHP